MNCFYKERFVYWSDYRRSNRGRVANKTERKCATQATGKMEAMWMYLTMSRGSFKEFQRHHA